MHRWASAHLSSHLDGELSPWGARALARHLAACPACSARLEGLREAQAVLRSTPLSAPPDEGWARLRERMAAPPAPAPRVGWQAGPRRRTRAWALAAGAAVLGMLGASLYLAAGPRAPAATRAAPSFVTTADLVEQDAIPLSPSIELVLVARPDGGRGEDQ